MKHSNAMENVLGDAPPKMEDLFVNVATEIEPHLGFLMTNTFGSHPLRILLLILSGEPIVPSTNKHVLHSRKKEHVSIVGSREYQDSSLAQQRPVPTAFTQTLEMLIYQTVTGLDTNQLRALAPHKTANPILQLLLRLELTKFGKQRGKEEHSIFHTLLPDENLSADSPSSSFVNGLIYDTIGSRLMEVILESAPGKPFKAIYKAFFKDKLMQLARNDTASYVVNKALMRVSKEDIQDAIASLGPEIPTLVDRNKLHVIRTLVERAVIREANLAPLADHINEAFKGASGTFDLTHLLKLKTNSSSTTQPDQPPQQPTQHTKDTSTSTATHASLLAQSLLSSPTPLSQPPFDSLLHLPHPLLLQIAHTPHLSPLLTSALAPSCPAATPAGRRKLIAAFYGHFGALALEPVASRVVEAVWQGTRGLAFMRERVAEELAENESALRAAPAGRKVWRAWNMDVYRRGRREWVARRRSFGLGDLRVVRRT